MTILTNSDSSVSAQISFKLVIVSELNWCQLKTNIPYIFIIAYWFHLKIYVDKKKMQHKIQFTTNPIKHKHFHVSNPYFVLVVFCCVSVYVYICLKQNKTYSKAEKQKSEKKTTKKKPNKKCNNKKREVWKNNNNKR